MKNKRLHRNFKMVFLVFGILFTIGKTQAQTVGVVKATGGSGAYKNSIWWLDFSSLGEAAAGDTITKTFVVNGITVYLTIDSISFSGDLNNGLPISEERLVPYASGAYVGDGLVQLYNIGVPNNGATSADRAQNTLYNAVGLKYNGNANVTTGVIADFRMSAYALTATGQPVDLSVVFADAETDNSIPGFTEYSQGTTNGSPWQLMEQSFADSAGLQSITVSNGGTTVQTTCGNAPGGTLPGNVAVMYTQKNATTIVDPLISHVEFAAQGSTDVAVGLTITNADLGDAPVSYGMPSNTFFSTLNGGIPPQDTTYYLSTAGTYGGTPLLPLPGTLFYSQVPRLGAIAGDPDPSDTVTFHTASADMDNISGLNDEDALSVLPPLADTDSTYQLTFSATAGNGLDANISGWVDINGDGVFEQSEFASATLPAHTTGNVTLNWSFPAGSAVAGTSYVRLRISSFQYPIHINDTSATVDLRSSENLSGGETEDYLLNVTSLPVKLTGFSGSLLKGTVLLNWATASEINNKGFGIQRSSDGIHFTSIAFVESLGINGNSNSPLKYSAIDASPFAGTDYYRLAQTDFDGHISYSNVIAVSVNGNTNNVMVQKNPFDGQLSFLLSGNVSGSVHINVFNTAGSLVAECVQDAQNIVSVNSSQWPTGVYIANVLWNNKKYSFKIIRK